MKQKKKNKGFLTLLLFKCMLQFFKYIIFQHFHHIICATFIHTYTNLCQHDNTLACRFKRMQNNTHVHTFMLR